MMRVLDAYQENVLFGKKTCENISQNMRRRKETCDPTKHRCSLTFTDNVCLVEENENVNTNVFESVLVEQ